jgi:precorrin-2/cobalt-factor-2 C20-methyltransferase
VTIVPGVSSLVACAAAARVPLVQRDATITVMPATLPRRELTRRLGECDSAAIIKLGRHAGKVREVLTELDLIGDAVYIERASQARERVAHFGEIDVENVPYFAMVLVRRDRG